MDLTGKVAIVTGAQRGIGQACAIKLAQLGAKVAVTDISEEGCIETISKIKDNGGEAKAFKMDVTDIDNIKEVKNVVTKEWKKIDILVNNAGIFDYEELEDMTKIDKILEVDLKGLMVVSKIIALDMVKNGYGKIVNITSIAALIGSPKTASYCTAKAGVTGFTRSLAVELGSNGINVNAVAPGAIETPMLAQAGIDEKAFTAMVPKKRIGQPEDIANAVAFLSCDESDYITGQVLAVDGGYTIM
ncbi:MAG: glucose 1-dehydrogenase [Candidatus Pacebacteria bacterium]|nr:glucose 1-dehydrogenase [Candidatus Paceibacterota bacterium]